MKRSKTPDDSTVTQFSHVMIPSAVFNRLKEGSKIDDSAWMELVKIMDRHECKSLTELNDKIQKAPYFFCNKPKMKSKF